MNTQRQHIDRITWNSPSIKGLFCYELALMQEVRDVFVNYFHR